MSALPIVAAFLRRDFKISLSYRAAFAFQFASMLFVLTLFFYLGKIVDEAAFNASLDISSGYFGYAVVGVALLGIVQVSLTSFSEKLREEQTTGTFESLIGTPAKPSLIILSSAAYDLLRATIAELIFIAAAIVIFGLQIDSDPASLATAALALVGCLGLFASLGVTVAAFTVIFKRTTGLLALTTSGLALLGGVYFPIEVLPQPIETIARALPFTWGLDVLRGSLLYGDVNALQLVGLFASAALLLPAGLLIFRRSLERARRTGTLAQY